MEHEFDYTYCTSVFAVVGIEGISVLVFGRSRYVGIEYIGGGLNAFPICRAAAAGVLHSPAADKLMHCRTNIINLIKYTCLPACEGYSVSFITKYIYTYLFPETAMSTERKLAMDIHGEAGKVAKYLSARFMQLRERRNELLLVEAHWDVYYLAELDLAASVLHQAIDNQSKRPCQINDPDKPYQSLCLF
jgi:hypothetical protein